jgi:hypothetical protein
MTNKNKMDTGMAFLIAALTSMSVAFLLYIILKAAGMLEGGYTIGMIAAGIGLILLFTSLFTVNATFCGL